MGNFVSFGEKSGVRIVIKNSQHTRTYDNINLDSIDEKVMKDIMVDLNGNDVEIVHFELSTPEKVPYIPSEERLMKMLSMFGMFKAKKNTSGFSSSSQPAPQQRIKIYTMTLNVTFDDKQAEISAKMLLFHVALIMNMLNLECNVDNLSLLGSLKDYRESYSHINEIAALLK